MPGKLKLHLKSGWFTLTFYYETTYYENSYQQMKTHLYTYTAMEGYEAIKDNTSGRIHQPWEVGLQLTPGQTPDQNTASVKRRASVEDQWPIVKTKMESI
jgi:hypothetical protein